MKTFRSRILGIIAECQQYIKDVESLNDNRPEHPPQDCEAMRVMLGQAWRALAAYDCNDLAKYQNATKDWEEET